MVKCNECGFLSVWLLQGQKFVEATEYFRENGRPENIVINTMAYQPKCFVQEIPINTEIDSEDRHGSLKYMEAVASVIKKDRICSRKTGWFQGRSPKEHQEMLDKKSERRWQVVHSLLFTVAGGIVALFSQWVVKPIIPVVNISPPAVNVITPPINVTVQAPPDTKHPKPKQSAPPETRHDPKPQQP